MDAHSPLRNKVLVPASETFVETSRMQGNHVSKDFHSECVSLLSLQVQCMATIPASDQNEAGPSHTAGHSKEELCAFKRDGVLQKNKPDGQVLEADCVTGSWREDGHTTMLSSQHEYHNSLEPAVTSMIDELQNINEIASTGVAAVSAEVTPGVSSVTPGNAMDRGGDLEDVIGSGGSRNDLDDQHTDSRSQSRTSNVLEKKVEVDNRVPGVSAGESDSNSPIIKAVEEDLSSSSVLSANESDVRGAYDGDHGDVDMADIGSPASEEAPPVPETPKIAPACEAVPPVLETLAKVQCSQKAPPVLECCKGGTDKQQIVNDSEALPPDGAKLADLRVESSASSSATAGIHIGSHLSADVADEAQADQRAQTRCHNSNPGLNCLDESEAYSVQCSLLDSKQIDDDRERLIVLGLEGKRRYSEHLRSSHYVAKDSEQESLQNDECFREDDEQGTGGRIPVSGEKDRSRQVVSQGSAELHHLGGIGSCTQVENGGCCVFSLCSADQQIVRDGEEATEATAEGRDDSIHFDDDDASFLDDVRFGEAEKVADVTSIFNTFSMFRLSQQSSSCNTNIITFHQDESDTTTQPFSNTKDSRTLTISEAATEPEAAPGPHPNLAWPWPWFGLNTTPIQTEVPGMPGTFLEASSARDNLVLPSGNTQNKVLSAADGPPKTLNEVSTKTLTGLEGDGQVARSGWEWLRFWTGADADNGTDLSTGTGKVALVQVGSGEGESGQADRESEQDSHQEMAPENHLWPEDARNLPLILEAVSGEEDICSFGGFSSGEVTPGKDPVGCRARVAFEEKDESSSRLVIGSKGAQLKPIPHERTSRVACQLASCQWHLNRQVARYDSTEEADLDDLDQVLSEPAPKEYWDVIGRKPLGPIFCDCGSPHVLQGGKLEVSGNSLLLYKSRNLDVGQSPAEKDKAFPAYSLQPVSSRSAPCLPKDLSTESLSWLAVEEKDGTSPYAPEQSKTSPLSVSALSSHLPLFSSNFLKPKAFNSAPGVNLWRANSDLMPANNRPLVWFQVASPDWSRLIPEGEDAARWMVGVLVVSSLVGATAGSIVVGPLAGAAVLAAAGVEIGAMTGATLGALVGAGVATSLATTVNLVLMQPPGTTQSLQAEHNRMLPSGASAGAKEEDFGFFHVTADDWDWLDKAPLHFSQGVEPPVPLSLPPQMHKT